MTDLSDLISRARSATGPDRELDAEIMFDLFAVPVGKRDDGGPTGYLWPEDNPSWSFGIRFPGKDRTWFKDVRKRIDGETLVIERDGANVLMNALRIPKLTASLDAAIELCERVLPNARIKFDSDDSYARAEIWQGRGRLGKSLMTDESQKKCCFLHRDGKITGWFRFRPVWRA